MLIQKSQISIFRKCLNLFEFENVFDLNSNLGFNFKICWKEILKAFLFISAQPNQFSPLALEAHLFFYLSFCFCFSSRPNYLPFWPIRWPTGPSPRRLFHLIAEHRHSPSQPPCAAPAPSGAP
jgi:hypothetical protein